MEGQDGRASGREGRVAIGSSRRFSCTEEDERTRAEEQQSVHLGRIVEDEVGRCCLSLRSCPPFALGGRVEMQLWSLFGGEDAPGRWGSSVSRTSRTTEKSLSSFPQGPNRCKLQQKPPLLHTLPSCGEATLSTSRHAQRQHVKDHTLLVHASFFVK